MPPDRPTDNATPEHGFATLRRFLPYLWPAGYPALKARVVIALLLVLAAKAAILTMPFAYKGAIDRMAPGQEPAVMLAVALLALTWRVPQLRVLAALCAGLLVVCAWDDRHGLPVFARLLTQLLAAGLACWWLHGALDWTWLAATLLVTWAMNRLAKLDSDSMYRRCPSAYIVSNASDDLPEPESPVTTIRLSRGISRDMFLRL